MKVVVEREKEVIDCYVGSVVEFEEIACMVIELGDTSGYYGLLALEGEDAGAVIERFAVLQNIDRDARVTRELIKPHNVVISQGE